MEDLLNEHGPNNHIDRAARIEGDPAKRPHPEGSTFDIDKMTVDERCPECKLCYIDPKPDDMLLYLHSFRYKVRSLCVLILQVLRKFFFMVPVFVMFMYFLSSLQQCLMMTSSLWFLFRA